MKYLVLLYIVYIALRVTKGKEVAAPHNKILAQGCTRAQS